MATAKKKTRVPKGFDPETFQQLRSGRLAYVESLRRNKGFEAGILRLLTQLYPDNAHFIYELLQNAEDATASHARFSLTNESLVFEHDGSRLFSARDVESITSIGDSTKADSPTEIGKFGVGFKAVFAYTQTPQIYSGGYRFRIRDLVVPELLPSSRIGVGQLKTKFIFPFDHSQKSARLATREIAAALKALDATTLLFLSNIGRISYVLPDGSEGQLKRALLSNLQKAKSKGQQIEVVVQIPGSKACKSNWLRYSQVVTIDDESTRKQCAIAIVFGLEKAKGRTKKSCWGIVPLRQGRVSIYFPAEKETSNLRFHMHAPFATTVARDSVRDCDGNHQLLAALADLVAESMVDIRDRGLLTVSALEVLPINDDNLPRFYEPIREKLVLAFVSKDLVPARVGSHRASRELFRGPEEIATLLNDEDLVTITGKKWTPPLWCAKPPKENQRAEKFLDSLSIRNWEWEELDKALDCASGWIHCLDDKGRRERLKSWLASKEDAWLQKFYALLHAAVNEEFRSIDVSDLCFVRVRNGDREQMVCPRDAFFPQNDADQEKTDIFWVKGETYSSGNSKSQKHNARSFLEQSGVRTFDEKVDLARLLETYKESSFPSESVHFQHLNRFVRFYRNHPKDLDIFFGKSFLLGTRIPTPEKINFCPPSKLCLDMPYEDTGLAAVNSNREKYVLWDGYANFDLKEDFVEFVKAVGVQAGLSIVNAKIGENPNWRQLCEDYSRHGVRWTSSAISEDWTIDGIELLLRKPSIESSRLIWLALIRSEAEVAMARFRPNQGHPIRASDSQLVCHLKGSAWIPDCDGVFLTPQEISRHRLRPDFPYDNRNGLLDAIEFEDSFNKETEDYQRTDQVVRDIGFGSGNGAIAVGNAIKEAGLDDSEAVRAIKEYRSKTEQPEEEVRNPARRRRGVLEHRSNAPAREAVQRERSIQPHMPGVVAEAKAYLRAKYTNRHGEMVCQVCQCKMPFKLKNGDYYFEAVQIVKGLDKHFFENRLALCPTCAAKYQYARSCSDADLRQQIAATEAESAAVEIHVKLAGEPHALRFVGAHFFDLGVVIGSSEPSEP